MKKVISAALAALVFAASIPIIAALGAYAAIAAYAADGAENVATGTGRSDVRAALGDPSEQSANGAKEVFALSDGSDAVIIYNEWGYVAHGYIVR